MNPNPPSTAPRKKLWRRCARGLALLLVWLVLALLTLWAVAALHFDVRVPWLRTPLVICYALGVLAVLAWVKGVWRKAAICAGGFILVLAWWFTLQPSNTRPWQPDVAQTAWAEINGDEITLHNVRNCDYVTETNYTVRWETRKVRLSRLTGVDVAVTYWGSPWMAHPILSFQFADALPVCFSVETRKEVGEGYSAVRGLFRQFELIYVAADERDVIRLRTNYRQGEEVYLYRFQLTPDQARARFIGYLQQINALHQRPRWYNAVTANCTTSIRAQNSSSERIPWNWRILLNGKLDEMIYERGLFATNLPFAELKQRAHINQKSRLADQSPGFSQKIRETLPRP